MTTEKAGSGDQPAAMLPPYAARFGSAVRFSVPVEMFVLTLRYFGVITRSVQSVDQ